MLLYVTAQMGRLCRLEWRCTRAWWFWRALFDSVELWHMGMAVQAEWQQGWQLRGILTVAKAWSHFLVAFSVFMSAVGLRGGDIV